jgi:phosphoadenosine phosphosulfate reductase
MELNPRGFLVQHSGGKDSVVIADLARRAEVPHVLQHSHTTVDPPELVRFVRTIPGIEIHKPVMSMWELIRHKGMPPRRNCRFCCDVLKESNKDQGLVVTGITWAESQRRAKRMMFERCSKRKTRWFLHPIIDWGVEDVWAYIRERQLPYCSLYDEGFTRLGCVLCPMSDRVERDIARWPRLCAQWERVVKATWRPHFDWADGLRFESPDVLWAWWLDRRASTGDYAENECPLFSSGTDPGHLPPPVLTGDEPF